MEIARLVGSDEDDADEALESRDAEHEAWRRARRRARLADPRASPEPAPLRSYPFSCGCLAGQAVRRGPGAREGESEVSLGISVVSGGQSDAGPGSTASTPPSRSSQEQRSSRLGEQEHADKKRGDKRGDKERLVKALAAESMLRAMAAPPRAKASRPQRCDNPRSDGRPGATLDSPSSDSPSDSPSDRPLDESYMATRLAQSMAESDVSAPSARPSRSLDLDSAVGEATPAAPPEPLLDPGGGSRRRGISSPSSTMLSGGSSSCCRAGGAVGSGASSDSRRAGDRRSTPHSVAGRGRPLYLDDVAWRAPALDSEEDEPAPRGPKVVLLPEDRSDVAAPRGGRW